MVHVEDIMTKLGGPYEFRDNPIKDQDFESQDWRLATLSKDLWRKVDLQLTISTKCLVHIYNALLGIT